MSNALVFWLILLLVFYIANALGVRSATARLAAKERVAPPALPADTLAVFESRLSPMLAITGRMSLRNGFEFGGKLRGATEDMFRKIREAFADEPFTPILVEGEANDVRLVLLQGRREAAGEPPKWWLHWLLFFATIATTTWAGALHAGVDLLQQPERFAVGLPYSVALLLILGSHELGHYFTARHHGIQVTPPFFIPVPFALGTFGAFIKIKSLTPNRRALFDVAVAGPLAGLVFAVPALLIGLRYSQVLPGEASTLLGSAGVNIDSSVLMAFLAHVSLGASALEGHRLLLHPLAFAGWLGLLITALNLFPIGQLDGGHMSHAMFGSRNAHSLSVVALVSLFLLALFVWQGLLVWAFVVYFMAGTLDAPAANDVTPVGFARKTLGYFVFLLLLLIIVPVPHALYETIGIHSPYL